MTEMQKQFEDWATSEMLDVTKYINTDVYCMPDTYQLWQAWQASRASVVVKLPDVFDGSPDNATYYDYMYRKTEMEKALDDAGVDYE